LQAKGKAKAYPLQILIWIVNDEIDGNTSGRHLEGH
jgi:hypothetical protein